MKNKFIPAMLLCGLALSITLFYSCTKEDSGSNADMSGKQKVMLYLNDDPTYDFTKVLVDIRYVEVKIDTSNGHHGHDGDDDDDHHGHDEFGHWDTLGVTPGQYDLLQLRNGVDTLLATGFVARGRITKIRFTLGDNNEVWTDSTHSQPLDICSYRHYVYAAILTSDIDTTANGEAIIRIDFNVSRSIVGWSGHYCLLPFLRPFCLSSTGSIEGRVFPRDITVLVTVFNNTDTSYAIPFHNGSFKVRGLNEGTYSVLYDPLSPLSDTIISNVQVQRGRETHLPDITLH